MLQVSLLVEHVLLSLERPLLLLCLGSLPSEAGRQWDDGLVTLWPETPKAAFAGRRICNAFRPQYFQRFFGPRRVHKLQALHFFRGYKTCIPAHIRINVSRPILAILDGVPFAPAASHAFYRLEACRARAFWRLANWPRHCGSSTAPPGRFCCERGMPRSFASMRSGLFAFMHL